MAWIKYRIEGFEGVNQAISQNSVPTSESPDAQNMDTFGGILSVAKGYVHHSEAALADSVSPLRLIPVKTASGLDFLVAAADGIYRLAQNGTAYIKLVSFQTNRTKPNQFDHLRLKIGSTEYLLLSNGVDAMHKWDCLSNTAALFGSEAQLSNVPVSLIELYFSRLFAAGNPGHPCRLYWSCAPGDTRTVEDWASVSESENVGGGFVEIGSDSEPITALAALSNQLVIFKKDSLYRLLGDRPANFRVYPVNAAMDSCDHTALVRYGDVLYFLTKTGLYYYDGQTAKRCPDADKVKTFLEKADLSQCTSAAAGNRLYFAVREGNSPINNAILVYDLARGTYMIRRGFTVYDLAAAGGKLFILDGEKYICCFDEGDSYAGREIAAHWRTPETDLGDKGAVKKLKELYLRGSGGLISVTAETRAGTIFSEKLMPENGKDILELPLTGEGRAFQICLSNVAGSSFSIEGGVELLMDAQRRIL